MIQRTLLQKALNLVPRQLNPKLWAMSQYALGGILCLSWAENQADNTEQAIEAFKNALSVITREEMPLQWAEIMRLLAGIYPLRIQGDRDENIERAIEAGEQALTVFTQTAYPIDWAEVMMNFGNAYSYRLNKGVISENIELAIEAYQQALTVITYENAPLVWIQCMNNLSTTYSSRICGDRAENIEQAIEFCQQALAVGIRPEFVVERVQIMGNLGQAYASRIKGRKSENLKQAIKAYQQALTVVPSYMVLQQAQMRSNLATTYLESEWDDRENIEKAIELYRQVLRVVLPDTMPVERALVLNNLGIAYSKRSQDQYVDTIESAIAAYQQALTISTRAKMPVAWARTMNNLATAYTISKQGERAKNIEKAITTYRGSLEVFTPELSPNDCRKAAYSLGCLYFEERLWNEAVHTFQVALQAAENLYQSAILLDSRSSELSETDDLAHRAAYALARTGNLPKAIEILERGRARGLSEALDRDRADLDTLQQQNPSLYEQYKDITKQLRNLEAQQRDRMISSDRHSITPEKLRKEATRLRQELTTTVDQIRQQPDYETFLCLSTFADVQQSVSSDRPLTYLLTTSAGSLALLVTPTSTDYLWLDNFTSSQLLDLLNNTWFAAYREYQRNPTPANYQTWFNAIEQTTQQLWNPLIGPLVQKLQDLGCNYTTLIPISYLGLLPLHAAWSPDETKPTGRRYALDDIHFTYAPNAKSTTTAQVIADRTPHPTRILAIDNPRQDLPNSEREIAVAVNSCGDHTILRHDQATIAAVKAVLPQADIAHFSCHGTANLTDPLNSGLLMSDSLLTLKDIFALNLAEIGGLRLAILSACETGLQGTALPDEAISLPTGLLQAGVAGVVASLWSVSEISTMVLLTRFYTLWRNHHLEPSQALITAQQWLRDAEPGDVVAHCKTFIPELVCRGDEELYRSLRLDFSHPYYWAAFSYMGV